MNKKVLFCLSLMSVLSLSAMFGTRFVIPVAADPGETEPIYLGVAKYYDNRKCVVTVTLDDFHNNRTKEGYGAFWERGLKMLTKKKIYHTTAIITEHRKHGTNWTYIQHWVDQGFTEAGSHSRNHPHIPYTEKFGYEWQINGSKNDIIGNLTLPEWWMYGDREYVYAWIEPYGQSDATVRSWLGKTLYLCDRDITRDDGWASWDSANGLFNRIGSSIEMGDKWGTNKVAVLNSKFDNVYSAGKIYHLMAHPAHVNWSDGNYADVHTDYISNRIDVWYVPFGLLYLYRWVDVRNIVDVTSTGSGLSKVFKLSIGTTDHLNYGVSYPITYIFDIPLNWSTVYAYYRYRDTDPWMLMANKSSMDFFNGITAVRFDSTNHKAYVSVGFSNVSDDIYLQLPPPQIIDVPHDYSTIQQAINEANPGDIIQVAAGTYYEHVVVNKTVSLIGENKYDTIINGNWTIGNGIEITSSNVAVGGFTIRNNGLGEPKDTGNGVYVYGSISSVSITDNIIINNTVGINLRDYPYANRIIGNTIINNSWWGIELDGARDNIIQGNMIANSIDGVNIEGSSNNAIVENIILDNSYVGIDIHSYSADNVIFHNNFINNTNQAFLESSTSSAVWDNGSEGNYWTDYNGTDIDGDGIGNTLLPHQGVDYYPLMSPYMEGDVNHDAIVDIVDIVRVVIAYGSTPEDPNWNPHADLNEDEIIDIVDIVIAAIHFGETWDWNEMKPRRPF